MHPLLGDLSDLTDDQLQQKINQINRVLFGSANAYVVQQAQQVLLGLQEEQEARFQRTLEKTLAKDQKLSDIIDIS